MKVLHLISQYTVSPVYRELVGKIAQNDEIYQEIYIPMKSDKFINKYKLENCPDSVKYNFSVSYNKIDRILYYTRIKKELKDLEQKINIKKIDYVHAHTLFADGGLAYNLKKKYGIHYIIAVRNTDIKGYLKKMPHCKLYLNRIIENADQVIFISPTMKKELEQHLTLKMKEILNQKTRIKPNGIMEYWHKNVNEDKKTLTNSKKLNFIQVSELDKNKNLYASIHVIQMLNKNGIDAKLTVVGEGREEEKYKKIVKEKQLESKVFFKGYIKNKDQLKELYRTNDIFIMLSKQETFGLVYVEAMSQGLPIIYTKGTGIDGYFNEEQVGHSLDLKQIDNIVKIIRNIVENYSKMSRECIKQSKKFQWEIIAKEYIQLYKEGNDKI